MYKHASLQVSSWVLVTIIIILSVWIIMILTIIFIWINLGFWFKINMMPMHVWLIITMAASKPCLSYMSQCHLQHAGSTMLHTCTRHLKWACKYSALECPQCMRAWLSACMYISHIYDVHISHIYAIHNSIISHIYAYLSHLCYSCPFNTSHSPTWKTYAFWMMHTLHVSL